MTDKVPFSNDGTPDGREFAIAHDAPGTWIAPGTEDLIHGYYADLSNSGYAAFDHTGTNGLDVTLAPGEAVVEGTPLARDAATTVSLPGNATRTVYLGWAYQSTHTVKVGLDDGSAADPFAEGDPKTALWTFTTDGTTVTATTDDRPLGRSAAQSDVFYSRDEADQRFVNAASGGLSSDLDFGGHRATNISAVVSADDSLAFGEAGLTAITSLGGVNGQIAMSDVTLTALGALSGTNGELDVTSDTLTNVGGISGTNDAVAFSGDALTDWQFEARASRPDPPTAHPILRTDLTEPRLEYYTNGRWYKLLMSPVKKYIDDFADGDLAEYGSRTLTKAAANATAAHGSGNGLHLQVNSSGDLRSMNGLANYPAYNDSWEFWWNAQNAPNTFHVYWACQSDDWQNCYETTYNFNIADGSYSLAVELEEHGANGDRYLDSGNNDATGDVDTKKMNHSTGVWYRSVYSWTGSNWHVWVDRGDGTAREHVDYQSATPQNHHGVGGFGVYKDYEDEYYLDNFAII